jgi:hypothetical protein
MKNLIGDLILLLMLGFSGFMLYLSYKMDKDPFWAQVACLLLVVTGTIGAGIFGWVSGYSWEQDVPLIAFYHIVAVIFTIVTGGVGFFLSSILAYVFLSVKAYENNWRETIRMLEKARFG